MLMFIHTSIYAIKNRVSYYYYIVYYIAYSIHIFVQLIAFKYIFYINMEIMIYVYISY